MTETRFLTFWRFLNDMRAVVGMPPLNFGEAHTEWRLVQRCLCRLA